MTWEGALVGLLLIVAGAAMLWTAWTGSQRRLGRNWFVGIRTRATMRSDEAWAAAHEEAAGPLGVGAGITALARLPVLASGRDDPIGITAAFVGVAMCLGSVLLGARKGIAAARRVDPG